MKSFISNSLTLKNKYFKKEPKHLVRSNQRENNSKVTYEKVSIVNYKKVKVSEYVQNRIQNNILKLLNVPICGKST